MSGTRLPQREHVVGMAVQLSRAKQQTILRQLNNGAKSLRGKGAPRKVNAQELFNYYDKKGRWAPRSKKGSGNRR